MDDTDFLSTDAPAADAGSADTDHGALQAQLVVFARELGELYGVEKQRSRDLQRALQAVEESYLATMSSLARVVEAKDETTRGHLDRTSHYGVALAERVDPDLAARSELAHGFFLHDIGKVGVPEHILCKRGPLNDDEWRVMRMHPVIGAQIVAPIRFLGGAVDVIRHHHEWFDGSGYPEGLGGDQIPLSARIFSIADCFDAMTSDRPYRDALQIEHALDEIRDGAGRQFDPDLVEEFLLLMEEDGSIVDRARAHAHVA
jgi:HD-GYP domain-containing protein (c-di-GMP phosphodiesterase class II)